MRLGRKKNHWSEFAEKQRSAEVGTARISVVLDAGLFYGSAELPRQPSTKIITDHNLYIFMFNISHDVES